MTKKPLPLIGRIQEKLVTGAGRDRPTKEVTGPRQPDVAVRNQADWLLERVRRTAAQFLSLAEHGGFGGGTANGSNPTIRRERALLLAYKLTLTAWRRREENTDRDVLNSVRKRMIRELRDARSRDNDRPRPATTTYVAPDRDAEEPRIRKTILDPADSDISASLIRFEAGLPGPLTPFYGDLAPTFGGPCPSEALSERYGKMVRHLYETVEKKLDERDRADAAARKATTRYAGAGS